MQFYQGHQTNYTYSAAGTKLKVIDKTAPTGVALPVSSLNTILTNPSVASTTTTDYVGNYIYENGTLLRILLPEGYWQNGVYYYYLKDHLGNNRVTINSSGTVVEKSHYYASGMRFYPESTSNSAALPFRYNNKEFEAMNGLNQYDYGARRRFAGLPIWPGFDVLAEKHYDTSPYAVCGNNFMNRVDPDGMDWYKDQNGNVIWQAGNDKTKTINDVTYNNIGETYTQQINSYTSYTFTQNDLTSITYTGIDAKNYVSQTDGTGCKVACDNMLAKEGVNSNGERINMVTADSNGIATSAAKSAGKGIKAVDNALENGNPIEVGVDYKPKQVNNLKPNGDGMTDHFVVISSKTENISNGQVASTQYNFFDPRSLRNGTKADNILTVKNNMLQGAYRENNPKEKIPYTVTTVRTSKK
jgi:hypothetical protein